MRRNKDTNLRHVAGRLRGEKRVCRIDGVDLCRDRYLLRGIRGAIGNSGEGDRKFMGKCGYRDRS